MITGESEHLSRMFERHFLQGIMVLTGNADPSDRVLPGATAACVAFVLAVSRVIPRYDRMGCASSAAYCAPPLSVYSAGGT